jgi:hypothetical protein
MATRLEGHVARLVTDDELILNVGSEAGVEVGDVFAVLDTRTQNIRDPISGKPLGSLDREKGRVIVIKVTPLMALARAHARNTGLSGAARVLSGETMTTNQLTSGTWREGIEARDPVVLAGKRPSKASA